MTPKTLTRATFVPLLIALSWSARAPAAQDTQVAPFLHGELSVVYAANATSGHLYQAGIDVGTLQEGDRGPVIDLRLGVLPGLELFGHIPVVNGGARTYGDVAAMCGDSLHTPETGALTDCTPGTMYQLDAGDGKYEPNPLATDLSEWAYEGLGNVTLGLRFAPLHEADLGSLDKSREKLRRAFPSMVTWRLEAGIILNTGENFYEGGAGSGSSGVLLGTSFSRRLGVTEPYLSVKHRSFSSYVYSADLTLKQSNETELFAGIEVIPYEDSRIGSRFAVDFATGVLILGEATVLSGSRLPVLVTSSEGVNGTDGEAVLEEAQAGILGRLRMHYQIFRYLRLELGGTLGYVLPHRLEQPYSVQMGSHALGRFQAGLAASF